MKAIRTTKDPHELEVGEWCAFHSAIYACCPGELVANLASHEIKIDADGELTVEPSILVNGAPGETWHGFILAGLWCDEHKRPLP